MTERKSILNDFHSINRVSLGWRNQKKNFLFKGQQKTLFFPFERLSTFSIDVDKKHVERKSESSQGRKDEFPQIHHRVLHIEKAKGFI